MERRNQDYSEIIRKMTFEKPISALPQQGSSVSNVLEDSGHWGIFDHE
ncbi:unnamed protein product [Protopolystoma xenopodis]|uniref:Uncharacterized protein n=1 Tax=Protopolystoma xenopodis TaxID=117903 RepID=A0A3S5B258_9PLAT|nr:unnamed protein product [Protopolystoma xenopodis]